MQKLAANSKTKIALEILDSEIQTKHFISSVLIGRWDFLVYAFIIVLPGNIYDRIKIKSSEARCIL